MKLPVLVLGFALGPFVTFAVLPGGSSSYTSAATPTPNPTLAPDAIIDTVAIDLDPTGNTATSIGSGGPGIDPGDIQSTLTGVPVNSEVSIDVVVDSVPDPGLYGIGFDLRFNQSIIRAVQVSTIDAPVEDINVLQNSQPPANAHNNSAIIFTNHVRVDSVGGAPAEFGAGRVANVIVTCISAGTSTLTMDDFSGNKLGAYAADPYLEAFPILHEIEASITCGPAVGPTPSPAPEPGPTPEPITGFMVPDVAIDLVTTGNKANRIGSGGPGIDPGDIQSAVSHLPIGSTIAIDVVVDSIPEYGLFGVGFSLDYDPGVVQVTGTRIISSPQQSVNVLHYFVDPASSAINVSNPVPDSDGHFRIDTVGFGPQEVGPGRLATLILKCVGAGVSRLSLTDQFPGTDGSATIGVLRSEPFPGGTYTVKRQTGAAIGCGEGFADSVPVVAKLGDWPSPGGAEATFEGVSVVGTTSISPLVNKPFVAGSQVIATAYEINTGNVFSGPVTVCLNYPDSVLAAHGVDSIALLHQEAGVWADVTTTHGHNGFVPNVCGQVSSLSQFAVAVPVGVGGTVDIYRQTTGVDHAGSSRLWSALAVAIFVAAGFVLCRRRKHPRHSG